MYSVNGPKDPKVTLFCVQGVPGDEQLVLVIICGPPFDCETVVPQLADEAAWATYTGAPKPANDAAIVKPKAATPTVKPLRIFMIIS